MNFNNLLGRFNQSLHDYVDVHKRAAGVVFGFGVLMFVVLLVNHWFGWYVPLFVENFMWSLLEACLALIPLAVSMFFVLRGGKTALIGIIPFIASVLYLLLLANYIYVGGFNSADDFTDWILNGHATIKDVVIPVGGIVVAAAILKFAKWAVSYGRPKK